MIKRDLEKKLLEWKTDAHRMPLLLRGARQVGKSHTVEAFGAREFKHCITVNFEFQPELKTAFNSLDPKKIVAKLELLTEREIKAGQTLLFLDEIQECPNAILALRYFKEQWPELHIVGAGSLLEFIFHDEQFRMPVGRVQFLHLYPLSFEEFLEATGHKKWRDYLASVTFSSPPDASMHQTLLELIRLYMITGGMPAVVHRYVTDSTFSSSLVLQSAILQSYANDFSKYSQKTAHAHIQEIYKKIPGVIAQNLKYSSLSPHLRSFQIKDALEKLIQAGLVHRVTASTASGIPLGATARDSRQKLLFIDIGLLQHALGLDGKSALSDPILQINAGSLAEQFVGQELLAYGPSDQKQELFFWFRDKKNSQAEIDYIIQVGNRLIPVEVKAGKTGQLRSLQVYLQEKNSPLGIRISEHPLSKNDRILSIPLYLISHISRLCQ